MLYSTAALSSHAICGTTGILVMLLIESVVLLHLILDHIAP